MRLLVIICTFALGLFIHQSQAQLILNLDGLTAEEQAALLASLGEQGVNIEDQNECEQTVSPCPEYSTCENSLGSYNCTCNSGFTSTETGENGDTECIDIDECTDATPCADIMDSECQNNPGSYDCCSDGYEVNADGDACVDIDECSADTDPCASLVGSTCSNNDGSFVCDCGSGYQANLEMTACEDINECLDEGSCSYLTGSECNNIDGSFTCDCLTGFEPIDAACEDIDECDADACDGITGSTCENTEGSYQCNCETGYEVNTDMTACVDIDECDPMDIMHNCDTNQVCENTDGGFTCSCADGYEEPGCTDISECDRSDACDTNALCVNIPGAYNCFCDRGYYGSGLPGQCTDVLPCSTFDTLKASISAIQSADTDADVSSDKENLNYYLSAADKPEGVPGDSYRTVYGSDLDQSIGNIIDDLRCDYFSSCSEDATSGVTVYTCTCDGGYQYVSDSDTQCEDIDECATDSSCGEMAECVNNLGSYTCICPDGYELEGGVNDANCVDIDECVRETDNCDSNADCLDNEGSFDCTCQDGYMGSGQTCESATSCEAFNKVKSAIDTICFSDEDRTNAETILGYYIDATGKPDPVPGDTFRARFGTDLPEAVTAAIELLRCDYFSNCSETVDSDTTEYECSCFDGYATVATNENQCTDEDECVLEGDDACKGTGTCVDEEGTYMCECSAGYEGGKGGPCVDTDECVLSTHECGVTGECTNKDGGYSCDCATGYEGGANGPCTNIDECSTNTDDCHDDATCTDSEGSHSCECNAGYQGDGILSCEDINECEAGTHGCDGNAACSNTIGSFECTCNSQYMGTGQECRSVLTCEAFDNLKQAISTIQNVEPANEEVSVARTLLQEYSDATGRPSGIAQNLFRAKFPDSLDSDIDNTLDLLRCDYFSECSYDETTYDCTCMAGYTSDEVTGGCQDIDECDASDVCHEHATCTNDVGSFLCTCNDGFFGPGTTCSDHDECEGEGGGHDCHEHANCTNVEGGHNCTCKAEYYGDGFTCQEVNTCETFNVVKAAISVIRVGGTDEEVATARKTLQEYEQAMGKTGAISGDSYRFAYPDPTDDDITNVLGHLICDYHSTCSSGDDGTHTCTCDTNHIPGDTANTCFNVQSCATFEKVKSAIDTVRENSDADTVAAAREILIAFAMADDLAAAVEGTSYRALYGDITDVDLINALDKLPCDFFSTCADPLDCSCVNGYRQVDDTNACTDIDECASEVDNNCHAFASCLNTMGDFECSCNDGFVGDGDVCEDLTQCTTPESTLCGANAQCTDTVGSFECSCLEGYTDNGKVCIGDSACLFSTDSDQEVTNCDEFDHPLSCSFKRDYPEMAKENFDAFRPIFQPPDELVDAVSATREETNFAATLGSIIAGSQSICRQSTSYTSPMKAYTDSEETEEVELFSYDCHRQWFTTTECEGTVEGVNAQCNTIKAPRAALVITRDDTTGKYEVMAKRVYLPLSCQFQFNNPA